jgi:hypothetical protein
MSEQPPVVRATDPQLMDAAVPKSSAKSSGRARRSLHSPHAHRFRAATALLVGLAIGALVVAVTVAVKGRGSSRPAVQWSSWRPPDTGTLGARDIADHVAPLYRLSAVDQLAVVTVLNLMTSAQTSAAAQAAASGVSTAPSSGLQVAVRPDPSSSAVSLLSGNTVGYNLCGIGGRNCAIGIGTPSANRLLLLRREALELALYTFKYISGTENVVAILPPGHAAVTSTLSKSLPKSNTTTKPVDIAVLFVRQELQPLLDQPLTATLPEEFPPTVNQMPRAPEAGLVDQITAHGLFAEQLQQAQDGTNLIVLNPLPPQ